MSYAWEFAKIGGLNLGALNTLLGFSAVMDTICFYYFFGEKINIWQFFGIFLMFLGIFCLGIDSDNKNEDADADVIGIDPEEKNGMSKVMNCFLAVGLTLFCALLLSFKSLIIRKFGGGGYTGFDQAVDSSILEGITYCFFLLPLISQHNFKVTLFELATGSLAAMGFAIGRVLKAISIAEGIAGPAQALSMQAIWLTLLIAIFGT